jgi:hypothetical protein
MGTLNADEEAEVRAARQAEHQRVTAEWSTRIVRAEFKAAAKGVLGEGQLITLLEDVDLSKYLDANGEPDEAKIAKKIATIAPAVTRRRAHRNPAIASVRRPGAQGLAMAEKRFGKKTATTDD